MARKQKGPLSTDPEALTTYGQVQALLAGISAAGSPGTLNTGCAIVHAALGRKETEPVWWVMCGDSNTEYGAAQNSAPWPTHFSQIVQRENPMLSGAAPTTPVTLANATSTSPGIRIVNNGHAGATSANYLPDSEIASIVALKPAAVVHAPGTNDAYGRSKTEFKTNLLGRVQKLRTDATRPMLQVLFLIQARGDITVNLTRWKEYGEAMNEIAALYPDDVVFVDASMVFLRAGVPGADPFGLMSSDKLHPANPGWQLLAKTLWGALEPRAAINMVQSYTPPPATPDTTAPTIASFSATPGNGQVTWAWSGSDNVGITRWMLKRGSTTLYDGSAASFTETGLTNGTQVSATLVAYDAAGNVSATSTASATPAVPSDTTAPTVNSFTATPGNGQNVLAWSTSDNVAVTRVTIDRGATRVYDGAASGYTDTGLTNGTAYSYTLTAYDAAGNTKTATVSATPTAPASGWVMFTSDSFSGGPVADINGRSTDCAFGGTAKTWKRNYAGGYGINSNNELVRGTGTGSFLLSGIAATFNLAFEITAGALPTGNNEEFHFRQTDAFTNTYYAVILATNGTMSLSRSVAGSVTYGLTANISWVAGDTIRIEAEGDIIRIYVNGVLKATRDESVVGTAKPTGVDTYMSTGANSVSRWDNAKWYAPAA